MLQFEAGGERTPLLLPIGCAHRTLTRGAVHLIIKQVFDNAIDHLQSTGDAHKRATERLRQASAHWLRHYVPFLTMSCN